MSLIISEKEKKRPPPLARERTGSGSSSSSASSMSAPRTPRFAEATTVHSPIEPSESGRSPFADPPQITQQYARAAPSDVGFGYISQNEPAQAASGAVPQTPGSPLKSAMKVPGTPARRFDNPLSPTFREEEMLEKQEQRTEKQQAKDLKVKVRVRMAKFILRGVNFSCSLIVLSMLCATFSIFNATKSLPARSGLPPWAEGTQTWPQIVVLVTSCISLALSLAVFWAYARGGHKRAEKVGVYYTLFAIGFFIFNIVMWGIACGILQGSRNSMNNKDIWGWSCVDNKRRQVFSQDIDYALVCRLQNWSLVCCLIEVVIEVITILIYGIVFYRYYSKRRLRKSMDNRDRARSDLYLAQLRVQSAPNTPGFGPKSPSFSAYGPKSPAMSGYYGPKSPAFSQYTMSPRFPPPAFQSFPIVEENEEQNPPTRFVDVKTKPSEPKPFTLQAPPIKVHAASPKVEQDGFQPAAENRLSHVEAAPGEQTYAAVPIPGAYASPMTSPAANQTSFGLSLGHAVSSDGSR